jgi:Family of unknown function (DUF5958)
MLRIDLDILLNQVAQGYRDASDAWLEIESLHEDEQRSAVRRAAALAQQAGMKDIDAVDAISRADVRPTRTSPVLLRSGRIDVQLAKIAALPGAELRDGFMLAVSLLSIADKRRREAKCNSGCTHWWHKDLRDKLVLARIRCGEDE